MSKLSFVLGISVIFTGYVSDIFAATTLANTPTTLDWSATKDGLASITNCQTALTQIVKDDKTKNQDSSAMITQLCTNTIVKAFDGVAPDDMIGFTASTGCTPVIPVATFTDVFTKCRLSQYPDCLWDQGGANVACSKQISNRN